MMKPRPSVCGLFFIALLWLISCENTDQNNRQAIQEIIESTRFRIENNFTYKISEDFMNVQRLSSVLNDMSSKNEDERIEELNVLLKDFGLDLKFALPLPSNDIIELKILSAVERSLYSQLPFQELNPVVFKRYENDREVTYNIGLGAFDDRFNPWIQLLNSGDSINIDVNEFGFGYFTVKKNQQDQTHRFEGIIQYYDINDSLKTLPFSYPQE